MIKINQTATSEFSPYIMEDTESGCFAEILPDFGATLHAFGIKNNRHNIQVIDHFKSEKDFIETAEKLGYMGCKLSPYPGRLRNGEYLFGNKKYRIADIGGGKHALHGLIYKKKFYVQEFSGGQTSAFIKMKYSYNNENPGYPFSYDCLVTYTLTNLKELFVETVCVNNSEVIIPIQDGWHPYFTLGKKVDDLEIQFSSESKYIFDDQLMATGELRSYRDYNAFRKLGTTLMDNSFLLDQKAVQPKCTLRDKENGVELQILPDDSYPVLQIYIPEHRNSIAIENLSGPPNAFNLGKGFIPLPPGQQTLFKTGYKINLI